MTRKILTLTLLAAALTLSAATPKEIRGATKQRSNSISILLSRILHKRGLDENRAVAIAQEFTGKNEELFSLMTYNFLKATNIKHDDFFNTLSTLALQRKKVDFSSYSSLIQLTQSMKNYKMNRDISEKLSQIATNNQLLSKVFA